MRAHNQSHADTCWELAGASGLAMAGRHSRRLRARNQAHRAARAGAGQDHRHVRAVVELAAGFGGDLGPAEGPLWWKEGGYLLFSDIHATSA